MPDIIIIKMKTEEENKYEIKNNEIFSFNMWLMINLLYS